MHSPCAVLLRSLLVVALDLMASSTEQLALFKLGVEFGFSQSPHLGNIEVLRFWIDVIELKVCGRTTLRALATQETFGFAPPLVVAF